jgi:hypothetical protein
MHAFLTIRGRTRVLPGVLVRMDGLPIGTDSAYPRVICDNALVDEVR